MRFKVKPEANIGDKKTVIRFAWFPVRIEDNIVWLEKYKATYIYTYDRVYSSYWWEKWDKKLLNQQD